MLTNDDWKVRSKSRKCPKKANSVNVFKIINIDQLKMCVCVLHKQSKDKLIKRKKREAKQN